MFGAIIGDVVGSPYEFDSHKKKNFPLFGEESRLTDDSILTICVGSACAEADITDEDGFKKVLIEKMHEIARRYPDAGYGGLFYAWLFDDYGKPYNGFTNGSAMRVSPCAWACDTLEDVCRLAKWSAEITHSHPDGVKGAVAVASAIFLARTGSSKEEIREYIEDNFYSLNFTLDEIRPGYSHDMTCEGSVPQALACFLEAEDFEDALRNAVSLGGDGDTLSAIAGSVAEAYFGIPDELKDEVLNLMDDFLSEYFLDYTEYLYR